MTTSKSALAVALAAGLGVAALCAAGKPADARGDALKAANAWLALVDRGSYVESWEQAAEIFRGAVTRDAWVRAVQGVRGPLGRVKSRSLKSAETTSSLPGAPDGQYVVIQYNTVFENKASGVETITPMLDKDKNWHVSGYFVR
jgi:hypothetical protein